jgi:hypothetical protein
VWSGRGDGRSLPYLEHRRPCVKAACTARVRWRILSDLWCTAAIETADCECMLASLQWPVVTPDHPGLAR